MLLLRAVEPFFFISSPSGTGQPRPLKMDRIFKRLGLVGLAQPRSAYKLSILQNLPQGKHLPILLGQAEHPVTPTWTRPPCEDPRPPSSRAPESRQSNEAPNRDQQPRANCLCPSREWQGRQWPGKCWQSSRPSRGNGTCFRWTPCISPSLV